MLWFLLGMVFGIGSLMCLTLCQVQSKTEYKGKIYFAASLDVEGTLLYLGINGVWGEFSLTHTLMTQTVKDLEKGYFDITGEEIQDDDIKISKIGIETKLIQVFK